MAMIIWARISKMNQTNKNEMINEMIHKPFDMMKVWKIQYNTKIDRT